LSSTILYPSDCDCGSMSHADECHACVCNRNTKVSAYPFLTRCRAKLLMLYRIDLQQRNNWTLLADETATNIRQWRVLVVDSSRRGDGNLKERLPTLNHRVDLLG
jgi:hypothetical protein